MRASPRRATTFVVTVTVFDRQNGGGLIPTNAVSMAHVAAAGDSTFTDAGLTIQEERPGEVKFTDGFTGFNSVFSPARSGVIDWGDGTPPVAATTATFPGRPPVTLMFAEHFYEKPGVYIIRLTTVPDETFSGLVKLADSGLTADPSPVSVPSGVTADGAVVATLRAFNEPGPPGLTALIAWGDGTPPVVGVITQAGNTYQVSGGHTFATPGRYTYSVKVTANDGESANVAGTAVVGSLNERFVAQAYRDLVARPVDPASLAYWTAAMDRGFSSFQVALALQDSNEGRALSAGRLYEQLMGQVAPPPVLANLVNFLIGGGTPEQLEANLIASGPYAQAHDAFGNAGFETALIQQVDHRARHRAGTPGDGPGVRGRRLAGRRRRGLHRHAGGAHQPGERLCSTLDRSDAGPLRPIP